MKIIGNVDATGNLKLRGRVVDKLVVDGGFYSKSYGETAYKTDLSQGSGDVVQNFYGLVVKETYTPANTTYKGINVLNFDTNFFYLSQNAPNTDEVVVNLRASPRTKVIYRTGMKFIRNEPLPTTANLRHDVLKFVIPANTFPSKILRISFQGFQPKTNSSDTQDVVITLNNTTIYSQDAVIAGGNGPRNAKYIGHMAMTDSTPSYLMFHMITHLSNAGAQAGGIGVGLWNTGTNSVDGYPMSMHIAGIDPTIDQTFLLKMDTGSLASNNQFYVMAAFVEEI